MNVNPKAVCRSCLKNIATAPYSGDVLCAALPERQEISFSYNSNPGNTYYCGLGVWLIQPQRPMMGEPFRKLWHEIDEQDEIVERGK